MNAGPGSYWADPAKFAWDELWLNHPAVRGWANRRVTGDPGKWPVQILPAVVPARLPFRRALSLGCGLGNLERSLIELSFAEHVTGVDASEAAIHAARRTAGESGLDARIDYVVADAREFLETARGWDAVLFHSSLHHFDRLPELLGMVRGALTPSGVLYLDEYVGPSRGEWRWRDLVRWNRVYRSLPRSVRRTRVIRPPINREDPTEAIASSGILPAVEEHFRVLARYDYGGNLLAVIYPSLLRPDQPHGPDPAVFNAAVNALMAREKRLLAREPGFHAVVIAEPLQSKIQNPKSKI